MESGSKLLIEPSNNIIGLFKSIKNNLKYESLKVIQNEKDSLTENKEEPYIALYLYKSWRLSHLSLALRTISNIRVEKQPRWKAQHQNCSGLSPKLHGCSSEAGEELEPPSGDKFSHPCVLPPRASQHENPPAHANQQTTLIKIFLELLPLSWKPWPVIGSQSQCDWYLSQSRGHKGSYSKPPTLPVSGCKPAPVLNQSHNHGLTFYRNHNHIMAGELIYYS